MLRKCKAYLCACAGADSSRFDGRIADEAELEMPNDTEGGDGSVKRIEWADVESLTCGFTTPVVGVGGFSCVYAAKGAAVKVHRGSERLHRAFLQELDALRRARHPHIVRLLAHCGEESSDEGALVLEYAPNGNLFDKLHGGASAPLPWATRAAVAVQIARALQFLHDGCDLQIVHGDVKSSNVLLDAAMDAKLCDFGSARIGFSAAVLMRPARQAMVGSPGYVDPHYLRSGMLTAKSDVYSFGVLILELLTGRQASCAKTGQLLAAVLGRQLRSTADGVDGGAGLVVGIVDRRLGEEYRAEEAVALAAIAARCVGENPTLRPSMAEVVRDLEAAVDFGSDGAKECR